MSEAIPKALTLAPIVQHETRGRYTITLDDDPNVCRFIARATGIESLPFASARGLMKRAASYEPIAAFVDVHLDVTENGLDTIADLRKQWPYCSLIVVTSDPSPDLIGKALTLGANDFVKKPLQAAELIGRLQARLAEMSLRRNAEELSVLDFTFSQSRSTLTKGTRVQYLSGLEARLLKVLLENRGMTVSKSDLKRRLWGKLVVSDNTLDKKISLLRQAFLSIESSASIKSIYRQGVTLVEETESTFVA